ncbi:MAG: cysteine hydrolase [Bacteroidota bacterium]
MKTSSFKIAILTLLIASCQNKTGNKTNDGSDSLTKTTPEQVASKPFRLSTKRDTITADVSNTAVIVIDMENDFGTKGGMFDRAGVDISAIQKAVEPTAKVLDAARKAGIKIIYIKMAYQPDLSDIGAKGSPNYLGHIYAMHVGDTITNPTGAKSRILIRGNWGTEIVPALTPHNDDRVMYKNRFSSFYKTELDSVLKQLNTKYLIVTGCTTTICVESTVRDAMFRDYSPIVLEDCTAEPFEYNGPASNHKASLFMMQRVFGWVSNSQEFIKAVSGQAGNSK